jgi:hypothetical protein
MALGALVLAVVSLEWQVSSWILTRRERRRTIVRPVLSISRIHKPVEHVVANVRVVNDSAHGGTVEPVSIHGTDVAGGDAVEFLGSDWSARSIPAHDGHSEATSLEPDFLDWSKPVVAQVLLASNLWFKSDPAMAPGAQTPTGEETTLTVTL